MRIAGDPLPAAPVPTVAQACGPAQESGEGGVDRSIVVLGIGNTLLTDDGAGVGVVARLQEAQDLPATVSLVDGGTLSFSLLADITDADSLIVVDAVQMNAPAGRVRCFVDAEMDRFLARGGNCSVHEVGLCELFGMARLQDRLPRRRALVAIQPERIEWGAAPSPAVGAALAEAADRVRALIRGWGS